MTWNKIWEDQMNNIFKCTEVENVVSRKIRLCLAQVFTPCPHELYKTPWGHHHWNPWRKLTQNHIWHGQFQKWSNLTKFQGTTGAYCKKTKLQFLEGPNAKMHLTMMTSSSSYPNFIYGIPLFAKVGPNQIWIWMQIQIWIKPEIK